jgi:transposase, IS30 family
MTYTHLTIDELVIIESYLNNKMPVAKIATQLRRARQTIYNVLNYLKSGGTVLDYYKQYKQNKQRCGRHKIVLPEAQKEYIREKTAKGWTPDVIIGRKDERINCSARTLYRQFKENVFDLGTLPMKGKRKPNNHKERRGKQSFTRNIAERVPDYPNFNEEFGHLEGDTIVGVRHKSAIITLAERMSKVIIALKPKSRKAADVERALDDWLQSIPRNLFKSITFDCGKEFSNWKTICNRNDISIYFADPGTPSQRPLNENSNGLLRKDGLPKKMDFNNVDQLFVSSVADRRNNIPRKSLNYRTPLEVFVEYVQEVICLA